MAISQYSIEEVRWQNDLAMFRSMDPHVPWKERFGDGKVKALRYNLTTNAGTWVFDWPPGYDPMGRHSYGGNAELFVLDGSLEVDGETLEPGVYTHVPQGEEHGPLTPGKSGCVFMVFVDGPLFSDVFLDGLKELSGSSRKKVQINAVVKKA
jgi:hypothetical protein